MKAKYIVGGLVAAGGLAWLLMGSKEEAPVMTILDEPGTKLDATPTGQTIVKVDPNKFSQYTEQQAEPTSFTLIPTDLKRFALSGCNCYNLSEGTFY